MFFPPPFHLPHLPGQNPPRPRPGIIFASYLLVRTEKFSWSSDRGRMTMKQMSSNECAKAALSNMAAARHTLSNRNLTKFMNQLKSRKRNSLALHQTHFKCLKSHLWLGATVLDSTALGHSRGEKELRGEKLIII